jgi:hypothetical protein
VPDSYLDRDIDCPRRDVRGYTQSLHVNAGKVS